jgi:anti-sigma regulatory factor (Ser/Thr protein kinase)
MRAAFGGYHKDMRLLTGSPTLSLTLPPVPESATRARRALAEHGLEEEIEHAVTLLVTEVVANSVRHAAVTSDIRVAATLEPGYARIEVLDAGPGFDPEIRHDTDGYGLRLVDKLASRWGVERGRGTLVWFEVDRRRRRFQRQP